MDISKTFNNYILNIQYFLYSDYLPNLSYDFIHKSLNKPFLSDTSMNVRLWFRWIICENLLSLRIGFTTVV